MICTENIHRITKYFLFSIFILFPLCFAQDEIELSLENHEGISWKPPRRHLLWSSNSSTRMNGAEIAVYIIAVIIITIISVCCKFCIKQGCEPTVDYSGAVVHPPPRTRNLTVPVAPSSGRRVLNPPRSSGSVILPPEEGAFSVDFTGIENPNYNPSIYSPALSYYPPTVPQFSTNGPSNENSNDIPSIYVPAPSYYSPTVPQFSTNEPSNENPTPLLDLPPSYESVMREQKFPKVN